MSNIKIKKEFIFERGLGTILKKNDDAAQLDSDQAAIAQTGVKALIPIDRPFLDYVLSALADAGYKQICLVVGPEQHQLRDYYTNEVKLTRITIDFAVQLKPKGTADAVAAAENFAANEPFIIINSDNYYPVDALAGLREIDTPGLAAFNRVSMINHSNVPAERITKFAVIRTTDDNFLQEVIEKPDDATLATLPESVGVSMNCWRFDSSIFKACRVIKPSPRGELEITDAVMAAMQQFNAKFKVLTFDSAVLDMSSRGDIESVAHHLRGTKVQL